MCSRKLLLPWPNLYSVSDLFPIPKPECCPFLIWINNLMNLKTFCFKISSSKYTGVGCIFYREWEVLPGLSIYEKWIPFWQITVRSKSYPLLCLLLWPSETPAQLLKSLVSTRRPVCAHVGQPTMGFPRKLRSCPWISFLLLEACINTWVIVCCATWQPKDLLGPYSLLVLYLKWIYINYPYLPDIFYLYNFTQGTIQIDIKAIQGVAG